MFEFFVDLKLAINQCHLSELEMNVALDAWWIIIFVFHSCNESYALSGVCEKADITMILLYKNFSRRLKMHEHDIFGTVEMEGAISRASNNAQAGSVYPNEQLWL